MTRSLLLAGAAALAFVTVAPGVQAQSDPAALQLIERLRPQAGGQTRGIRVPGAVEAHARRAGPGPARTPVRPAARRARAGACGRRPRGADGEAAHADRRPDDRRGARAGARDDVGRALGLDHRHLRHRAPGR